MKHEELHGDAEIQKQDTRHKLGEYQTQDPDPDPDAYQRHEENTVFVVMALAGAEEPGDNGDWSRVTHSSVISVPEDQELLTLGALPTENYMERLMLCVAQEQVKCLKAKLQQYLK